MFNQHRKNLLVIFCVFGLMLMLFVDHSTNPATKSDKSLKGKIIVIDPGHGDNDTGCTGPNNFLEKDITLKMAQKLGCFLKEQGAVVKYTRTANSHPNHSKTDDLDNRITLAVKYRPDLFISLHVNSSSDTFKNGVIVYFSQKNLPSMFLAKNIQQNLNIVPHVSKRTSQPRGYYLLNHLKVPSVVIELGYLSNNKDCNNLSNLTVNQKITEAITKGIINYFNSPLPSPASISSDPAESKDAEIQSCNPGKLPDALSIMSSINHELEQKKLLKQDILQGVSVVKVKILKNLSIVNVEMPAAKHNRFTCDGEWNTVRLIAATLLQYPQIQKVQILINGERKTSLAGHIDISNPLTLNSIAFKSFKGNIVEGYKAKIAIVIDDFGSNWEGVKEIFSIDRPLTMAVMPNLQFSKDQAETADHLGYEVIVHLPMEPKKGKSSWLGPGAITSRMTPEEIKKQACCDFDAIPFAIGFNNHMGSLICRKENLIRPILEAAKEKNFFVLDSVTDEDSQLAGLAEKLGMPCTKRDVFLDNKKNVSYIKKQLDLLGEKALTKGSAIGIGHVGIGGCKTAQALREMIPVLEKKGIEFVYLSELIQQ